MKVTLIGKQRNINTRQLESNCRQNTDNYNKLAVVANLCKMIIGITLEKSSA